MKNSHHPNDAIRQNEHNVSNKHSKHDANLQKNHIIFFQVGLILVLIAVYSAFEMQFKSSAVVISDSDMAYAATDDIVIPIVDFKEELPAKKSNEIIEKVFLTPETKISEPLKNKKEAAETQIFTEPPTSEQYTESEPVIETYEPEEEDYNILSVQRVPVFPGCEKSRTNADRRQCMSKKIARHISKKFNTDIGSEEGLNGLQRIYVTFKINKYGETEILRVRAPHPRLEKESKRVINALPKITPGKVNDRPVNVLYTIPINFKIEH